jgi:signal transduction histidine kinase
MTYALRVRRLTCKHQSQWVRAAVAAAVVVIIALTLALNNCGCDEHPWLARLALVSLVGICFAAELIWGRWPRWTFALCVAAPVGWLIFTDNGSVAGLMLLVMVGWTVYTGSLRDSLLACGVAVLAVLGYVHFDTPDRWLPWVAGIVATCLMMRMFVMQQTLIQQLRAAQADLERTAVVAERRRIAGEIHDVAAHALALSVLHLTGLRLRVQRESGDRNLVESLAEAERLGRQSLDDIRRTVGLLQDDVSGIAPPLPGAGDIQRLVGEYQARGLEVGLELHGEPAAVAPATGLALYRIVQESLANAVKHAPGADVRIRLELNGDARLSIRNALTAQGIAHNNGRRGHGLGGMRERAQLLGGRLQAGPDDEGWLVECVIPTESRQ